MKASGFKYLIGQGVENIWKNRMMAFASFCVLLVSLLLVGMSVLFYMNLTSMIGGVEDKNEVIIYMDEGTSDQELADFQSELAQIPNISEISFYSKEQAFEDLKNSMSDYEVLFDSLGDDNPLIDSYRIRVEDISQISATITQVEGLDHIDSIRAPMDFVNVLTEVRKIVTVVFGVIIAALVVISVVIVSNATKASVFARREEIQIKGDLVMKGYWNREKDTKNAFTEDGWLKTGDQGAYDGEGRLKIVGRIKEILVTSTGEKISPVDIESALETIPLFRQTYAVGDGMPYIAVLISLDPTLWKKFAAEQGADPKDPESIHAPVVRKKVLEMVKKACRTFPAYAVPKNIALTLDEWTIDNGLLTPTLKLKRSPMQARYGHLIEEMYKGAKKSRI